MKTGKFRCRCVLLLALFISVPLSALGGFRDGVVVLPGDDVPWGGEVGGGDYGDDSAIRSTIDNPEPVPTDPFVTRHIGTSLGLFDYIRSLFSKSLIPPANTQARNQIKSRIDSKPTFDSPSSIRAKRSVFRKGR